MFRVSILPRIRNNGNMGRVMGSSSSVLLRTRVSSRESKPNLPVSAVAMENLGWKCQFKDSNSPKKIDQLDT